jgi:hypothetical protein
MQNLFANAISCFAASLARLSIGITPASFSSRNPRHVRGRQQNTPLFFVASTASCNVAMRLPCRVPGCLFP